MTIAIDDAYAQVLAAPSDVQGHLATFRQLVIDLDAQVVIELGVRGGTSTVAWLAGLARTGGHLWAVDSGPAPFMHPSMTFIQGLDLDTAVLGALPRQADIIFVDTDHTYELTTQEALAYGPRVAEGGCIVFHDTAVETFPHHQKAAGAEGGCQSQPPFPVRKAVTEAALAMDWEVDWTEECNGLAVCWPKGES